MIRTTRKKKAMMMKARIKITMKKKERTIGDSQTAPQKMMNPMKKLCQTTTKVKLMSLKRKNWIRNNPLHRNSQACQMRLPQLLAKVLFPKN